METVSNLKASKSYPNTTQRLVSVFHKTKETKHMPFPVLQEAFQKVHMVLDGSGLTSSNNLDI